MYYKKTLAFLLLLSPSMKKGEKRKDNIKGDFSYIRMTDQEQFVVKICSYKMVENIGIMGQGQLTLKVPRIECFLDLRNLF